MDWSWLQWAAVAVLGGVVGSSELISRYKDNPGAAIKSAPAIELINVVGENLLTTAVNALGDQIRSAPAA